MLEVWQMLSKSNMTGKYYWHGAEITETEYNHIKTIIDSRPTAPDGFSYRLTENLEWELYELPTEEPVEELTETEEKALAYDILMGVSE
jgi:hypothetical protein